MRGFDMPGNSVHTVRLRPAHRTVVLDDHVVDCLALELDPVTGRLGDFRIELGRGYFIVWVIPIARGGRLRSILVDSAVVDIEPQVELDPCAFDFGPEEWTGDLGRVGAGRQHRVELVRLELRARPFLYECRARVRHPDGTVSDDVIRSAG